MTFLYENINVDSFSLRKDHHWWFLPSKILKQDLFYNSVCILYNPLLSLIYIGKAIWTPLPIYKRNKKVLHVGTVELFYMAALCQKFYNLSRQITLTLAGLCVVFVCHWKPCNSVQASTTTTKKEQNEKRCFTVFGSRGQWFIIFSSSSSSGGDNGIMDVFIMHAHEFKSISRYVS